MRSHVTAELEDSGPDFTTVNLSPDSDTYSRAPRRYTHQFWIALPVNASVESEVIHCDFLAIENGTGTQHGPYTKDDWPDSLDVAGNFATGKSSRIDQFRGIDLHRADVWVADSSHMVIDGERTPVTLLATSISIKFTFDASDSRPEGITLDEYDPYLKKALENVVANEEQLGEIWQPIETFKTIDEFRQWNEMLRDAAKQGPILFGRLPRGGFYRLNAKNLGTHGIDPGELPVDRIRVFAGSEEIPAYALDIQRNSLLGKGELIFYVPIDEARRKPYLPLWVFLAPEGETGKRMTPQMLALQPDETASVGGYINQWIFRPNEYDHELQMSAPTLRWFTGTIPVGDFSTYEFEAPKPDPSNPLRVTLWLSPRPPGGKHRGTTYYQILINGKVAIESEAEGRRVSKRVHEIPGEMLRDGTNTFTLQNLASPELTGKVPVQFLLAELDIPTLSTGLPINHIMKLDIDEPTSMTLHLNRHDQMPSRSFVADVRQASDPVLYQFSRAIRDGQDVYTGTIDANPRSKIIHAPGEFAFTPSELEKIDPPRGYFEDSPAEYLIIYPESLEREVKRLANYRAADRAVEMITVEDLYKSFSYGALDPQAITRAIHHIFASRPGARLSQVLLIGEASEYWWENKHYRDDVAPNMLPVPGWQNPRASIRGDEEYVLLLGSGSIPELEIGRISVSAPEELRGIVDKIINYEQAPPPGEWRNRHVFFTDDESEFLRVAKDIVAKSFTGRNRPVYYPLQTFQYENYFRGRWRKRSVAMTDAVVDALNEGAMTAVYLGHGGPNLWSGERIFHIRDIDRTHSEGRLPILTAGSCDTGWIDYPIEPVKISLSEHFLKHPGGGTIAAYIPVSGTSSYEHNYLLTAFYRSMLEREVSGLGLVCLQSKIDYYLDRNNVAVTEQFLLMGDPALRIVPQPEIQNIGVAPNPLLSVTGGLLRIGAAIGDFDWGTGSATFMTEQYEMVVRERFRIRNGTIDETIEIPQYLEPGNYHLLVSIQGGENNNQYSGLVDIQVVPTDVRIEWLQGSVSEDLASAGKPIRLPLRLINDSAQDLVGMEFQLLDGLNSQVIGSSPVSIPANSEITPSLPRPIPVGMESVVARIIVPIEEQQSEPVIIAETNFQMPVFSELTRYISFPASAIEVIHQSGENGTTFRFPVYNLTPGTLANVQGLLYWQDPDSPGQIGQPAIIESLPSGEKQIITFNTDQVFRTGEELFSFELYQLDTDPPVPLQTEVFSLAMREGPDIELVPGSLHVENENVPAGSTVFVNFTVRNAGDAPLRNIEPALYIDRLWEEEAKAENAVPWVNSPTLPIIYPGETHSFRLRWDPIFNDPRKVRIYATALPAGNIQETDLTNNAGFVDFQFLPNPNLRLLEDQIEVSRKYVQPYDIVSFTIPIANTSDKDFLREFRLTGYSIKVDGSRERHLNQRLAQLRAGETAVIQFDWIVQPWEYAFYIEVNEDREYLEATHNDNTTRIDFTYVLADSFFKDSELAFDFTDFPNLGSYQGVHLLPDGSLILDHRPMAFSKKVGFHPRHLVEGQIGRGMDVDGLWGESEGMLFLNFEETASAVYFRLPLDADDGTTLYDIYFNHVGNYEPQSNSGHFRYRIENDRDWRDEIPGRPGDSYAGRIQTRDGVLDLELKPFDFPSYNLIYSIRASPVKGRYESPVIKTRRTPSGRLLVNQETPSGSRIEYAVRHGHSTEGEIEWAEWQPAEPGENVPFAPESAGFYQWRATFFGTSKGDPILRSVRIETEPGNLKDEEQTEPQEIARVSGAAPAKAGQ